VEQLFEEYKKYSLLHKKDSMMSGVEPGTISYLVSVNWLKKYMNFILFDQFKREVTENDLKLDDDHFEKNFPGPISNEQDFLEKDQDGVNLYGTGQLRHFESEFIDRFVFQQSHPNQDFYCVNEELWEFLFGRYGGQIVKRYYAR